MPWWPLWTGLLIAAMGISLWWAWRDALRQGEASTIARWIATRAPLRVTDTPGVVAWLRNSVLSEELAATLAAEEEGGAARRDSIELMTTPPGDRVPRCLEAVAGALDAVAAQHPVVERDRRHTLQVRVGEHPLIVTGPVAASDRGSGKPELQTFAEQAAPVLDQLHAEVGATSLPSVLRVVRAFAASPTGSFVSSLAPAARTAHNLERERAELGDRSEIPFFGTQEFFFADSGEGALRYSSPYLDLGGSGLVCSLLVDTTIAHQSCVLAVDLAIDLDWQEITSRIDAPLHAAFLNRVREDGDRWQPWNALEQASSTTAMEQLLVDCLAGAALAERSSERTEARASVHHTDVDGGTLTALQVAPEQWFLVFAPAARPRTPFAAAMVCALVLATLWVRSDRHRREARNAERQARAAVQSAKTESQEKERILDALQVPLVTVDPNNDEIVYRNAVAEGIGIQAGQSFGRDVVADGAEAQAHYRRAQEPSGPTCRSYGVPLRLPREGGFAVVRSIAIEQPIPSFHADERHRLGILFLLDEEADLSLYLANRLRQGREEERARLSGLLDHGLVRSTRLVAQMNRASSGREELGTELASGLTRRVEAISWLLERWGRPADAYFPESVVRARCEATLERSEALMRAALDDAELRRRLGWNNGTLAESNDSGAVLEWRLDWPDGVALPQPAPGLFGFLIDELVANAACHGIPGSVPHFRVDYDPGRRELEFEFRNQAELRGEPPRRPFGGLALLAEIARACRFEAWQSGMEGGEFVVRFHAPTVRIDGTSAD